MANIIMDKFRAVKGKAPKKTDIVDWSEGKILAYLMFIEFWVNEKKDGYEITNEKRLTAEARGEEDPYWGEFLARMDRPLHRSSVTAASFRMTLFYHMRIVLGWLRDNPYAVTPPMSKIMNENGPMTKWASSAFIEKETDVGAKVVEINTDETVQPGLKNQSPKTTDVTSPEVHYNNVIKNLTSLADALISGIKPNELRKLDPEKKLKLVLAMIPTLAKALGQTRPNTLVFKQLNINQAGRQDLEAAILDYQGDTQEVKE